MANWHIREAKNRRGEFGDKIDQEIMEVIALHIGEDDSPATMSIATIARMAGCHYNTADKRTKTLADAGWLKIEKRGRFLAYGLTFESEKLPEDERPPGAEYKRDLQGQIDGLERDVADLKEQLQDVVKVVKELHTTVTRLSHDLHIVITSHQSDYVKKEGKKGRREEEKNPPLPPLTETPADQRVKAILDVCNLQDHVPEHRNMAENASAQLARYNAGDILARYGRGDPPGWNWWRDDWRGQKGQAPTPIQVVQLISQPRPKPSTNGHGQHEKKPLYEPNEDGVY